MQAGISPPTVDCVAIQSVTPCDARIHSYIAPRQLEIHKRAASENRLQQSDCLRFGVCDLSQWRCICDSMRCYPWSSHSCTVMQTASCPHVSGHFQGMRQFVLVTNQLTQSPWLRPGTASVTLAMPQTGEHKYGDGNAICLKLLCCRTCLLGSDQLRSSENLQSIIYHQHWRTFTHMGKESASFLVGPSPNSPIATCLILADRIRLMQEAHLR